MAEWKQTFCILCYVNCGLEGGRIVDGPRLNFITAHDDCDPIAATPYHKNIAVHLAPVVDAEANAAEAAASRVRAVAAAHVSAA